MYINGSKIFARRAFLDIKWTHIYAMFKKHPCLSYYEIRGPRGGRKMTHDPMFYHDHFYNIVMMSGGTSRGENFFHPFVWHCRMLSVLLEWSWKIKISC